METVNATTIWKYPRKKAVRDAHLLGARLVEHNLVIGFEVTVEAPNGYVWVSDPSIHELVERGVDRGQVWHNLITRMSYGIVQCAVKDCEWCADTSAELNVTRINDLKAEIGLKIDLWKAVSNVDSGSHNSILALDLEEVVAGLVRQLRVMEGRDLVSPVNACVSCGIEYQTAAGVTQHVMRDHS